MSSALTSDSPPLDHQEVLHQHLWRAHVTPVSRQGTSSVRQFNPLLSPLEKTPLDSQNAILPSKQLSNIKTENFPVTHSCILQRKIWLNEVKQPTQGDADVFRASKS